MIQMQNLVDLSVIIKSVLGNFKCKGINKCIEMTFTALTCLKACALSHLSIDSFIYSSKK